jgi:hypothetical protein
VGRQQHQVARQRRSVRQLLDQLARHLVLSGLVQADRQELNDNVELLATVLDHASSIAQPVWIPEVRACNTYCNTTW